MTLSRLALICAALAVPMFAAKAQLSEREPGTMPSAFQPLAFMAGSCWDGPLPGFVGESLGVGAQVVTHCVRWDLEKQVLRDTLRMESLTPPVRGETTYYFDLETKTVRYIFLSTDGSHSVGSVKTDGDKLVFDDERLIGPRGVTHFRTTWTPAGPDAFVQNRQRARAGGAWTKSAESTFVRKPMR